MAALPRLSPARPEEILLPVRIWFVLSTLVASLILNLLPAGGVWLAIRPDFLALTLLYWCIQQPRMLGVGVAWLFGLVMDVGDGTLFGQHALAYSALAYAAEFFHRRVLRFPLWHQAAHVAALLILCGALVLIVRLMGGAAGVSWTYFLPAASGALLWPVISVFYQLPQRPARSPGER
jgi:rod shape-determining protein MreD